MNYLVRKYGYSNTDYNYENFIVLETDNWDDYHYKTTFHMKIFKNNKEIEIGSLRILHISEKTTSGIIDDDFDKLTEDFVSIGCDADYYESLIYIYGESKAFEILNDLKDMSISKLKESKFELEHPGIQNSLFRSSNARYLYEEVYNSYFSAKQSATDKDYCFTFKTKYEEEYMTDINIDFKKHNQLPNRLFALIGKNGVGKTRLLNQLSESLFDSSNEKNKGRFIIDGKEEIPAYQKIIAISFSAFDNFFKAPIVKLS